MRPQPTPTYHPHPQKCAAAGGGGEWDGIAQCPLTHHCHTFIMQEGEGQAQPGEGEARWAITVFELLDNDHVGRWFVCIYMYIYMCV